MPKYENYLPEIAWTPLQEAFTQPITNLSLAFDVDPDGEGDVVLSDGGEEGAEVDEPVDAVRHHDLLQVLEVQDVRKDERTWRIENVFFYLLLHTTCE